MSPNRQAFIMLLFFCINMSYVAAAGTEPEIYSVVCDAEIDVDGYGGVCLVTLGPDWGGNELRLRPAPGTEVTVEGAGSRMDNGAVVVSGLEGGVGSIRVVYSSEVSSHRTEMLPFVFYCDVGNAMIAVNAERKKFVWDVDFPAYSLYGSDQVIRQDSVSDEDVAALDSVFLRFRDSSSDTHTVPPYRVYTGRIEAGGNAGIRGWVGGGYEYYLPYMALAGFLCMGLYTAFNYVSGRGFSTREIEDVGAEVENGKCGMEQVRSYYTDRLSELEGDEHAVYKLILEEEGAVLQKALPAKAGFSKAKVSRVLDRLEQKGLVERKSYGVTNNVVLR